MKKFIYLLAALLCLNTISWATAPNWSIESNKYEFSTSFTAVVELDGIEIQNEEDQLAAWVNGELRGVIKPTYVQNLDRYYFFLLTYSNVASNEELSFSYYDASEDQIIDLVNLESFVNDKNQGSFSTPYVFSNKKIGEVVSFSFVGITSTSVFDTTNNSIILKVDDGTDLTNLVANFNFVGSTNVTVNGVEQTSGVTSNDFTNQVTYVVTTSEGEISWTVKMEVLSIVTNEKWVDVKIYPNPAINQLMIEGDFTMYQLVSLQGKIIIKNYWIQKPIDVSFLSNGIYLLQLFDENGNMLTKRFVK